MHPNYSDQRDAIDWARNIFDNKSRYVILDTETTGLGKNDEIIQIGIIDINGNTLLNQNIRPQKKKSISRDATDVHGLTMTELVNCPTFSELKDIMNRSIGLKDIIAYNAEFDLRLYKQSYQISGGFFPKGNWHCAMLEYARFIGEWDDYHGNYRWHKLKGLDHTAVGDCLATLAIIRQMVQTKKLKNWYEFWVGR
ncbi:MAG: 3'-5' exonuclease [Sedimentisphaerales bacterium]|jgi:DNA polymerase-3 subunit epsilon